MPRDLSRIARDPVLRAAALRACPPGERERFERDLADSVRQRARRASAGALAQDHGATWEAVLDAHHAEAARLGLADVVHTGPVVIYDHHGDPVVVGRGGADYHGVLKGGRTLVAEAKSFEGRCARSKLPDHQCEQLARWEALGALALLLLELRPGGRYAVPWGRVPWRARGAHERGSVGPEELREWEIAAGERCYLAKLVEVRRG